MVTMTGPATEEEMIATFLLAELDSPRYSEAVKQALAACGATEDVLRNPDMTDQSANDLRRETLVTCRGWGQQESVFGGLPSDDVNWSWVKLEKQDLQERVFTIVYYFEETLGTRRLVEIADMGRRGDPEYGRPILEAVLAGRLPGPPILLADPSLERLVILEGHNRMLSYMADPNLVPFPIRALIGQSSRISEWSEW